MTTLAAAPPRSFSLSSVVFAIPVIGWMLRELAVDPVKSFVAVIANLVLTLAVLTAFFGFGVIMVAALTAAPLMLGLIMFISSDFVD